MWHQLQQSGVSLKHFFAIVLSFTFVVNRQSELTDVELLRILRCEFASPQDAVFAPSLV